MKIALASDEVYAVNTVVLDELTRLGHEVVTFGALSTGKDEPWVQVAEAAALSIITQECAEGVFFCWSGTGICMAANKVSGIRAALCTDAQTARAARTWNHANVLCLSNRSLAPDVAKEIISAWFESYDPAAGAAGVEQLVALDVRSR
jgi:ribose 5-phosphate isomerase B